MTRQKVYISKCQILFSARSKKCQFSAKPSLNHLCSIRLSTLLGDSVLDLRFGNHTSYVEPIEGNKSRMMQIAKRNVDFVVY